MRLTCPSCGAVHSAEAWANDAQARAALQILTELPPGVARGALGYLALFRSARGRGMQWSRAVRLLDELRDLVSAATIQWDRGVARPNAATAWVQAIERLVQRPPTNLPLKSHNYLRAIAYEIADEMDRQREVKNNAAIASGAARRRAPAPREGRVDLATIQEGVAKVKQLAGRGGSRGEARTGGVLRASKARN